VEPNPDMRKAGEEYLSAFPQFSSVAGTAEATTLPDHSIDIITAAQAAHWFDRAKARKEFVRILKPQGWTVLLWNERQTDSTPFLRDYERLLLTYGTDYKEVRHERTSEEINDFFAPAEFAERDFETQQQLDYPALEGRLLSSSYTPLSDDQKYAEMLRELRRIFDQHAREQGISLRYTTRVFYGHLM
jgi:SAM-dependent methyltransferase